jgi:uncharacterized protein (DUF3084 family)
MEKKICVMAMMNTAGIAINDAHPTRHWLRRPSVPDSIRNPQPKAKLGRVRYAHYLYASRRILNQVQDDGEEHTALQAISSNLISPNDESISTNDGTISTNDQRISANGGTISTNDESISTNDNTISPNDATISTNDQRISTNEMTISTNDKSIRITRHWLRRPSGQHDIGWIL